MELERALKAVTVYMAKPSTYTKIVENLFEVPCCWDLDFLQRFEAAIPLTSNKRFFFKKTVSYMLPAADHSLQSFLISLFRAMFEVYAKCWHESALLVDLAALALELRVLYNLIKDINHNYKQNATDYLAYIADRLSILDVTKGDKLGQHLLVSSYYGEVFCNYFVKNNKLFTYICNSGFGRGLHIKRELYGNNSFKPLILKVNDIENHLKLVPQAFENKNLNGLMLCSVYYSNELSDVMSNVNVPVASCVVKSYLHTMEFRLKNASIYKRICINIRRVLADQIRQQISSKSSLAIKSHLLRINENKLNLAIEHRMFL